MRGIVVGAVTVGAIAAVAGPAAAADIHGGPGNDRLIGGPGNDRIFGYGGDDYIDGGGGADYIRDTAAVPVDVIAPDPRDAVVRPSVGSGDDNALSGYVPDGATAEDPADTGSA